jgi:hypothetical protein
MTIPFDVPERLKTCGIPVTPDSEDNLAWKADDALAVVETVDSTKIAIIEINVYREEAWGFVPTDDNWSCDRMLGETASEFAGRTHECAREFIRNDREDRSEEGFYELIFSDQQDAA